MIHLIHVLIACTCAQRCGGPRGKMLTIHSAFIGFVRYGSLTDVVLLKMPTLWKYFSTVEYILHD